MVPNPPSHNLAPDEDGGFYRGHDIQASYDPEAGEESDEDDYYQASVCLVLIYNIF